MPAQNADTVIDRLRAAFVDQIRAHGRVHHRSLLKAMRRHLENPATESAQDLAMLLRHKLGLLPQKIKDIASVRQALDAASSAAEENSR